MEVSFDVEKVPDVFCREGLIHHLISPILKCSFLKWEKYQSLKKQKLLKSGHIYGVLNFQLIKKKTFTGKRKTEAQVYVFFFLTGVFLSQG